ncbi:MAG: FixH family protein [Calditrichia bacterium]|nr:FixH family protein [Calditrichia bacterium]
MKIKFNWGYGIALFYSLFFAALVIFVIFTFYLNWDLVTENYYKDEIEYQKQIDRKKRAEMISQNIFVNLQREKNEIIIAFPEEFKNKELTGTISLYRPSNAELDKKIPILLNSNGLQKLNIEKLQKGAKGIKITWTVNEAEYYHEKQIVI